jgi:hypothetical protein
MLMVSGFMGSGEDYKRAFGVMPAHLGFKVLIHNFNSFLSYFSFLSCFPSFFPFFLYFLPFLSSSFKFFRIYILILFSHSNPSQFALRDL